MSMMFPEIELNTLMIGQSGFLDFSNAGITAALGQYKNPAHILMHNESGTGLQCTLKTSGYAFYFPAGAWSPAIPLIGGESGLIYRAIYELPNPPVSKLLVTYYAPNEGVPSSATLGNSPIGIGGTIQTSNSQLINTTNPPGSTTISVIPNDTTLETMKADTTGNFSVFSDDAGVLSSLLQLIAGASPQVLLGAATILTEVLGDLIVDGDIAPAGNMIIRNNKVYQGLNNSGVPVNLLSGSNTNKTIIWSAGSDIQIRDASGNVLFDFSPAGQIIEIPNGANITVNGNTRFNSATNTHVNAPSGAATTLQVNQVDIIGVVSNGINCNQILNLQGNGGWRALSTFTGTSNGGTQLNVAHNLGQTPDRILMFCTSASGTCTISAGAATATTCTVVTGASGITYCGLAIKIT